MFGDITDAERLAWQRRAASCLTELLKLAAKEHLPPVAWTVAPRLSVVAEFRNASSAAREEALEAWKLAIIKASGRPPETDAAHTFAGGETRLTVRWQYLPVRLVPAEGPGPAVNVTLVASIFPDEEEPDAT
jgi:hypothetical protein